MDKPADLRSSSKKRQILYIVLFLIVIIILFSVGGILYNNTDKFIYTNAIISDVKCELRIIPTKRTFSTYRHCNFKVKYMVNNKEYIGNLITNDRNHYNGEVIGIAYNKNDSREIKYKHITNRNVSIGLFVAGGIVTLLLILYLIFMKKM